MLLLVCVCTASLRLEAAPVAVPAAVTQSCGEADLACVQLLLLQKQDEVVSLGKRIGLREAEVELLEHSLDMVREQANLVMASNKSLLEAANKLVPHWYESPWLWFGIGVFVGGGLVVLGVYAAAQVFMAH